jgi:hypothetical protein
MTATGTGVDVEILMGADLALGGMLPGTIKPLRAWGGGGKGEEAGATATGTGTGLGGVTIGPDTTFGVGNGGAESALVLVLGGTGGAVSEEVLRSGGGASMPVFALAWVSGETPGSSPLLVRTFAGGGGGTPARRPVRALGGGTVGTDEVFGGSGEVGGSVWTDVVLRVTGTSKFGSVGGVGGMAWTEDVLRVTGAAGVSDAAAGRSTRRREPVMRLSCADAETFSTGIGWPGTTVEALAGGVVETGSVGFFAEEAPAGARGGMIVTAEVSGGWGVTVAGTGMAEACIGSGGVIGAGGLARAVGMGGGVAGTGGVTQVGGFASTTGAGGVGSGVEGVTFGNDCEVGSEGGVAS